MRNTLSTFVAAGALAFAGAPALAQLTLPRPSPNATVSQVVGVTDVKVTYSRPSVKGRVIWGELVPWDKVWRTGANEATTVTFGGDVTVAGNKVPAGTYSLHTIPGKDEWTVIINKDANQWGSYSYDQAKDAFRFKVKPEAAPMKELLTFSFPKATATSADLAMTWDKVRISIPIEVDTHGTVLSKAKKAVGEAKPEDWQTPYRAANYVTDNKLDATEAKGWLDKSISINANYWNTAAKARALAAEGKTAEAVATAEKALQLAKDAKPGGSAAVPPPDVTSSLEKQVAEWKAKK